MPADPTPTEPDAEPGTDPHPAMLDELLAIGMDLARTARFVATAEAAKAADAPAGTAATAMQHLADAFDRTARAIRRTILLRRALDTPKRPAPTRPTPELMLRNLARSVENAIDRADRPAADKEALTTELHERLERPDMVEQLAHHSTEHLLAEICSDLGIAARSFAPAKRRTPADLTLLDRRVAHAAAKLQTHLAQRPTRPTDPPLTL